MLISFLLSPGDRKKLCHHNIGISSVRKSQFRIGINLQPALLPVHAMPSCPKNTSKNRGLTNDNIPPVSKESKSGKRGQVFFFFFRRKAPGGWLCGQSCSRNLRPSIVSSELSSSRFNKFRPTWRRTIILRKSRSVPPNDKATTSEARIYRVSGMIPRFCTPHLHSIDLSAISTACQFSIGQFSESLL